jgi:hypothetical protein
MLSSFDAATAIPTEGFEELTAKTFGIVTTFGELDCFGKLVPLYCLAGGDGVTRLMTVGGNGGFEDGAGFGTATVIDCLFVGISWDGFATGLLRSTEGTSCVYFLSDFLD